MSIVEQEELFIIEALLFASPHPLTQKHVNQIFENNPPKLNSVIEILRKKYNGENDAFEIHGKST